MSTDSQKIHSLDEDEDDEEEENGEDPLKNFNLVTEEIPGFPSFTFGKYFEKRCDLEHEFRKLINTVEENGNEILYFYESSEEKNESKTRIKEFLDTLDNTVVELIQTFQLPAKIDLIKRFYSNNNLQEYQDLIQRDFYPEVENIPTEFSTNDTLDLQELFQDFNPTKNKGQINFEKFKPINPPDNLSTQFPDENTREDDLYKYDKYLCVVNSILSIRKLQEFSSKYNKNDEEYNRQEELLTKEALSKLDPDEVSKARKILLKSKKTNKLTYPTGDLTKDIDLLKQQINKLEKSQNKIKQKYKNLQDENNELKKTNSQLNKEIEEISQNKKSIETSYNKLNKEFKKLQESNEKLNIQIKGLEGNKKELQESIEQLKLQIK